MNVIRENIATPSIDLINLLLNGGHRTYSLPDDDENPLLFLDSVNGPQYPIIQFFLRGLVAFTAFIGTLEKEKQEDILTSVLLAFKPVPIEWSVLDEVIAHSFIRGFTEPMGWIDAGLQRGDFDRATVHDREEQVTQSQETILPIIEALLTEGDVDRLKTEGVSEIPPKTKHQCG